MQKENYKITKKIDIENKFSDLIYKEMRAVQFGMASCCSIEELDSVIFEKNLCDWQDSEVYAPGASFSTEEYVLPKITGYPQCNAAYPTEYPPVLPEHVPDWVISSCSDDGYGKKEDYIAPGTYYGTVGPGMCLKTTNVPVTTKSFTLTIPASDIISLNNIGITTIYLTYRNLAADYEGYNDEYYYQTAAIIPIAGGQEVVHTVYISDDTFNSTNFTGAAPIGAQLSVAFSSDNGEYWIYDWDSTLSTWDFIIPDPDVTPNIWWSAIMALGMTEKCWTCATYVTGYKDRGTCLDCHPQDPNAPFSMAMRAGFGCQFCGLSGSGIVSGNCNDDSECIKIIVTDEHDDLVEGYNIILDGKDVGKTDYRGQLILEIKQAGRDWNRDHTLQNCFCFVTSGSCNQQLIKIKINTCKEKISITTPSTTCELAEYPEIPTLQDHNEETEDGLHDLWHDTTPKGGLV